MSLHCVLNGSRERRKKSVHGRCRLLFVRLSFSHSLSAAYLQIIELYHVRCVRRVVQLGKWRGRRKKENHKVAGTNWKDLYRRVYLLRCPMESESNSICQNALGFSLTCILCHLFDWKLRVHHSLFDTTHKLHHLRLLRLPVSLSLSVFGKSSQCSVVANSIERCCAVHVRGWINNSHPNREWKNGSICTKMFRTKWF